ncbi:hypothetical protein ACTQ9L_03805 [Deinococcus wulumuqiensis]
MKKLTLSLLALTALSSASAAERFGFYLLGAQYERDTNATDSFRVGLGLPVAGVFEGTGVVGVTGNVGWLRHTRTLNGDGTGVQPYYGAGLGLSTVFASNSQASVGGVVVYPHVLGGANFGLNDRWALFAEASAGVNVYAVGASSSYSSDSTSGVGPGFGLRVGASYRIR